MDVKFNATLPFENLTLYLITYMYIYSLALPDRFFPFVFVAAEKRVWSGSQ